MGRLPCPGLERLAAFFPNQLQSGAPVHLNLTVKKYFILLVLAGFFGAARLPAQDLPKSFAELHLTDGRVLTNVQLVGFSRSAVMAKWDGGRGTLAYTLFPESLQDGLAKAKPAPDSPEDQAKADAAAKEYADKLHAAELKRRAASSISTPETKAATPNKGGTSADAVKKAIEAHQVIVGMTHEQVVQSWGNPTTRIPARGHGREKWIYEARSTSVIFDHKGLVANSDEEP